MVDHMFGSTLARSPIKIGFLVLCWPELMLAMVTSHDCSFT